MQVSRKTQIATEEFKLCDQIAIKLKNLGDFTATVRKISDDGVLLIFDSIVVRRRMNSEWTNEGGFENSELNKWMQSELLDAFPEELKSRIKSISIPTYGQMFGHDDFYKNFEEDDDEQLLLMKNEKNRVATFEDETCSYWLKNATKKSVSSAFFALVVGSGRAGYDYASYSLGVLPVILLS